MKRRSFLKTLLGGVAAAVTGVPAVKAAPEPPVAPEGGSTPVSLTVRKVGAAVHYYEQPPDVFRVRGGDCEIAIYPNYSRNPPGDGMISYEEDSTGES